ncbi:hypothetical protein D3C85_1834830 [compost metagenome]
MRLRDHLLEAGIDFQSGRLQGKHHSDQCAQHNKQGAVVEHQALQPVTRALVEVLAIRYDRHGVCGVIMFYVHGEYP